MKHGWLVVLALAQGSAIAQVCAERAPAGQVDAQAFVASDSEHFDTRRAGASYWLTPCQERNRVGIGGRLHWFEQDGWNRSGQQVLLLGQGKDTAAGSYWQGEAGVLSQHGKNLATFDATYHGTLGPATSWEAFANRDFVETAAALDQGIHVNFFGASLEHGLNAHLTGVALLGHQSFSDGNERLHGRLRLIYQPFLDSGFTVQARYRWFRSEGDEGRRAYFNPDRYHESMVMAGWRKRSADWTAVVLAGVGRQRVGEDDATPTRLLDVSLEKRMTDAQVLSLKAGYNQSASYGGPDYRYKQVQLQWQWRY
ncbi:hypothetical protein [Noviherbaspirillum galbum]|uniref:YaiO family outer membrane beta-barrel protein n=1 Tax=Noviherbaspirillum galbum TaxID=2709383 RepID=A0A6B3SNR9_9BURK|nr:hypothetical protein [Noviherbaspirillum galbum]NEX62387.1 hypothetical protein [Noviherbaspirillum galbum]